MQTNPKFTHFFRKIQMNIMLRPQNPSKFCFYSAKLSQKNFVNLMGLPTFYLDSWNYLRKNKYKKDKFYIQAIFSVVKHRLNYCFGKIQGYILCIWIIFPSPLPKESFFPQNLRPRRLRGGCRGGSPLLRNFRSFKLKRWVFTPFEELLASLEGL